MATSKNTSKNTSTITESANIGREELSIILGQIGAMAADLDTLLYAIPDQEDGGEAMMRNAARLVGQIGWMADQCQRKITPLNVIKGDATSWLLPPAYHEATAQEGGAA